MKKIIVLLCLFVLVCSPVFAFIYQVKILTKEEIKNLKDSQIQDVYVDVMIEKKASETFHQRSGFAPKEYQQYKELLGMVIRLRQEMLERKIEASPIDEWIK
ncbi:MAG: hypothetical protein KKF78_07570 [Candidatus Omnitrophica bacterium]|nr:hypothetical protein [Candidatus Omnitrophota bacterium]MBU1996999.1 hypothetical protein [Candidatus Omnitrophota bacterium]